MAYAQNQEELTTWESFLKNMNDFKIFLYNKEKGEVMGRDGKSWAKISLFFFIFYSCLAAFFAAMLTAFYTTVPSREDGPKLIQYLVDKPGVNSFPLEIKESYDPNDPSSYEGYVDAINDILEEYDASISSSDFSGEYCATGNATHREKGSKMCLFNKDWLGNCSGTDDNSFGFKEGKPCILLRMNKIYSWIPEPTGNNILVNVSCSGADVTISPPGFYVSFFPFWSEEHYLAPLVAIKLKEKTTESVSLECKVIGNNIEHSETFRRRKGAYGQLLIEVAEASS